MAFLSIADSSFGNLQKIDDNVILFDFIIRVTFLSSLLDLLSLRPEYRIERVCATSVTSSLGSRHNHRYVQLRVLISAVKRAQSFSVISWDVYP